MRQQEIPNDHPQPRKPIAFHQQRARCRPEIPRARGGEFPRRLSRQIFDFVYSIFQKNSVRGPRSSPLSLGEALSVGVGRCVARTDGSTGHGVTEEKNKFDQSEGGSYRFGYGFRKRRRILFLRKPDKRPFTRVFSHTRHPHVPSPKKHETAGVGFRSISGEADFAAR